MGSRQVGINRGNKEKCSSESLYTQYLIPYYHEKLKTSLVQGVCRRLDDLVLSNLASISSNTLGV